MSEYTDRFPEHVALVEQLLAHEPVPESPGVSAPGGLSDAQAEALLKSEVARELTRIMAAP